MMDNPVACDREMYDAIYHVARNRSTTSPLYDRLFNEFYYNMNAVMGKLFAYVRTSAKYSESITYRPGGYRYGSLHEGVTYQIILTEVEGILEKSLLKNPFTSALVSIASRELSAMEALIFLSPNNPGSYVQMLTLSHVNLARKLLCHHVKGVKVIVVSPMDEIKHVASIPNVEDRSVMGRTLATHMENCKFDPALYVTVEVQASNYTPKEFTMLEEFRAKCKDKYVVRP